MKNTTKVLLVAVCFILTATTLVSAAKPTYNNIQSGLITDPKGNIITVGSDKWGYNYQAQMFNGYRNNWYRPTIPVTSGDWIIVNWNSAYLNNIDRDLNGKLDQHYGFSTYKGSGAWITFHEFRSYLTAEGGTAYYDYFVKLVAVPADATVHSGYWYNANGIVIGLDASPSGYVYFAYIQEVYNDPYAEITGIFYNEPLPNGLGFY